VVTALIFWRFWWIYSVFNSRQCRKMWKRWKPLCQWYVLFRFQFAYLQQYHKTCYIFYLIAHQVRASVCLSRDCEFKPPDPATILTYLCVVIWLWNRYIAFFPPTSCTRAYFGYWHKYMSSLKAKLQVVWRLKLTTEIFHNVIKNCVKIKNNTTVFPLNILPYIPY